MREWLEDLSPQERNEMRELASFLKWTLAYLLFGAVFTMPFWGILAGIL